MDIQLLALDLIRRVKTYPSLRFEVVLHRGADHPACVRDDRLLRSIEEGEERVPQPEYAHVIRVVHEFHQLTRQYSISLRSLPSPYRPMPIPGPPTPCSRPRQTPSSPSSARYRSSP